MSQFCWNTALEELCQQLHYSSPQILTSKKRVAFSISKHLLVVCWLSVVVSTLGKMALSFKAFASLNNCREWIVCSKKFCQYIFILYQKIQIQILIQLSIGDLDSQIHSNSHIYKNNCIFFISNYVRVALYFRKFPKTVFLEF